MYINQWSEITSKAYINILKEPPSYCRQSWGTSVGTREATDLLNTVSDPPHNDIPKEYAIISLDIIINALYIN